jgi:hypothetical protein
MPATPDAFVDSRSQARVDNFDVARHAANVRCRSALNDSTAASRFACRLGPAPGSFALTSLEDSRSK